VIFLKSLFLQEFKNHVNLKKMEFKKISRTLFLLAILIGLAQCKNNPNDILYNRKYIEEIKNTRKELAFFLSANLIPGATIAVTKGGEIIYSEGMGLASKDLEVPVTRQTKFRIGDLSELYTSLAYHLLVEKGTLHPDSTIQHYLPDFPAKEFPVTLNDLVNHMSGIRGEYEGEKTEPNFNITLERGLEKFKNDSLLFPPGNYQLNSKYNYNLVGAIMEKTTGKKFDAIIKELITDTLQLNNTVSDNPFNPVIGRSNFYDHTIFALTINAVTKDLRVSLPSNGLLSNAEDLVKLGNAMLYSDYISDKIKKEMFTVFDLNSGFAAKLVNGWMVSEDFWGRKFYGRSGFVTGGGASILIFPEEELVVAVTINLTMDLVQIPDYKIARYFLPKTEAEINAEKEAEENKTDTTEK
jgi:CubicO group peptidase (beta-lactamase class C family)